MTRGSRRGLVVALALAAVLLVLAFQGVDWGEMFGRIASARPGELGLACLALSCSMFIRGLRWRLLIGAERWLSPLTTFWGVAVGYIGNGFLPARAGELLRSALVSRRSGLDVGYVLATALTERILDALGLVTIALVVLALFEAAPDWLVATTRLMAVVAVAGVAGVLVLPWLEAPVTRLLGRLPLSSRLRDRLIDLATRFLLGLRAVRSPPRAAAFYALTVVIWLIDAVAIGQIGQALGLTLPVSQALLLLAALGLSSSVPSTPGYVGIYQFVAVTVMPGFGFGRTEALAFILTLQAVTYLVIVPWGLFGLWRLSAARDAPR